MSDRRYAGFQVGFQTGPIFRDLGAVVRAAEAMSTGWPPTKVRHATLYGVLADDQAAAGGLERIGGITITARAVEMPELEPWAR